MFEDFFIPIAFFVFRKFGLLIRYTFFFIIGKKRTFAYLDREETEPNWFSERGVNFVIGLFSVLLIVGLIIYFTRR